MNSKFVKILALFFIPVVIMASGGVNLFVHFCSDISYKEVSIFAAPNCEHHHKLGSCYKHFDHVHYDKSSCESCCHDEHVFIKTVSSYFPDFEKIVVDRPSDFSLLDFNSSIFDNTLFEICESYSFFDYTSPPIFSPQYLSIYNQNLRLNC